MQYAVMNYIDGGIYVDINFSLRDGSVPKAYKDTVEGLDEAMKPLDESTVLHRVMDKESGLFDGMKPGDRYVDKSFVSTTIDENAIDDIVEDVGDGSGEYDRIEIEAPAGTQGLYTADVDGSYTYRDEETDAPMSGHDYSTQRELILGRGQTYEYLGEVDGVHRVRVIKNDE